MNYLPCDRCLIRRSDFELFCHPVSLEQRPATGGFSFRDWEWLRIACSLHAPLSVCQWVWTELLRCNVVPNEQTVINGLMEFSHHVPDLCFSTIWLGHSWRHRPRPLSGALCCPVKAGFEAGETQGGYHGTTRNALQSCGRKSVLRCSLQANYH